MGEIESDLPAIWASPPAAPGAYQPGPQLNQVHARGRLDRAARAARTSKHLRVEVSDTGGGISPEDLPRLFQDFFRATAVKGTGTGLGLFIAQRIVEGARRGSGPRVRVPRPPGQQVRLSLPAVEEPPAMVDEPASLGTSIRDRTHLIDVTPGQKELG